MSNQASEDRLERACDVHRGFYDDLVSMSPDGSGCDLVCWVCHILPYKEPAEHIKILEDEIVRLIELIRTEKLKLLDEVVHQSTVNLKSSKAVAGWAELRKEQLGAEL